MHSSLSLLKRKVFWVHLHKNNAHTLLSLCSVHHTLKFGNGPKMNRTLMAYIRYRDQKWRALKDDKMINSNDSCLFAGVPSQCDDAVCNFHGHCLVMQQGSVACSCDEGYTGTYCETGRHSVDYNKAYDMHCIFVCFCIKLRHFSFQMWLTPN